MGIGQENAAEGVGSLELAPLETGQASQRHRRALLALHLLVEEGALQDPRLGWQPGALDPAGQKGEPRAQPLGGMVLELPVAELPPPPETDRSRTYAADRQ